MFAFALIYKRIIYRSSTNQSRRQAALRSPSTNRSTPQKAAAKPSIPPSPDKLLKWSSANSVLNLAVSPSTPNFSHSLRLGRLVDCLSSISFLNRAASSSSRSALLVSCSGGRRSPPGLMVGRSLRCWDMLLKRWVRG